ncbi:MAG: sulfite exporter TauE/SafE family protein [Pseudomonadota bacterium]
MPDPLQLILHAAAAVAAFFQSVTGIGFGMIAGPVVLVILEDPAAVVISTLMSWLIGLVLFPFLRHGTDWRLALRLLGGAVLGLPFGLFILGLASVAGLKLLCGVVIASLTAMMLLGAPGMRTKGLTGDLIFGALAGFFGGCLAMPGPTAVLRAGGIGLDKATVRATMVSFFALVWPMIFLGQWATLDLKTETFLNAAMLVPATLAGLALGNYAATRVSERFFRALVIFFLIATATSLLFDAARSGLGDMI